MSDEETAAVFDDGRRNLNVASDQAAIYESGHLLQITIPDLLENEAAIRQLINSHNLESSKAQELRDENAQLRLKQERYASQPIVSAILELANVVGVVLIGFGAGGAPPDVDSDLYGWLLVLGILLVSVTALVQVFYRKLVDYISPSKG